MNDEIYMFGILGFFVLVLIIVGAISMDKEKFETERYKLCVDALVQAIPDPNDDSRASFLKDCQED